MGLHYMSNFWQDIALYSSVERIGRYITTLDNIAKQSQGKRREWFPQCFDFGDLASFIFFFFFKRELTEIS